MKKKLFLTAIFTLMTFGAVYGAEPIDSRVCAGNSTCVVVCSNVCRNNYVHTKQWSECFNKKKIYNLKKCCNENTTEATTQAAAKPVETTTQATTAKPVETTTQATTAKPVETTTQATTAKPVETTTQATTAKPVETTTEATTQAQNSASKSMEQQVVDLVNAERAKYGLGALKIDSSLSKVAQAKSDDMMNNNYFSHTSPTYGSPFDMMKSFGITYSSAGENIAKGQKTAQAVVDAWMNSEGHRANILSSSFTKIGVGYSSGKGSTYWSQMFTR